MIQNPTLPMQQMAVQQQLQQAPAQVCPMPSAEFNAIKINIQGAQVSAPGQQPVTTYTGSTTGEQPLPTEQTQNLNYLA